MDIKISSEEGNFKFRVVGILKNEEGKILIQKVGNNDFYCFPGGHVEIGESSEQAVERELEEELQFDVCVERLAFIIENFYFSKADNRNMHELGYYYILSSSKCPKEESWIVDEIDKGIKKRLVYRWVSQQELDKLDVRPQILKSKLNNFSDRIEKIVLKNK